MKPLAALLILALLFSALALTAQVDLVRGESDSGLPLLSMPVEYVNYTIVNVNGSLWAKIDGTYPMHMFSSLQDLPMVYPTPPGTTTIQIKLDEKVLDWSNYTALYPDALHHTAIGDWSMIYCTISPASQDFVLKIHYEHPLQTVNGSQIFLYDLNISPYLSPQSNSSTCYFTIRMDTNSSNLNAYTTETDAKWNPINYTTAREGGIEIINIAEHSEYGKPLLGDLAVVFSTTDQVPEFPIWTLPALLIAVLTSTLICIKRKRSLAKP